MLGGIRNHGWLSCLANANRRRSWVKRRLLRARIREGLQRGDDPKVGHRLGDLGIALPSQRGGPRFNHGDLDFLPSRLRGHAIQFPSRDHAMYDPMIGIELVQTSLFERG